MTNIPIAGVVVLKKRQKYMKKFAERFNILRMTPKEQDEYTEHMSKTLKDRDYLVTAKAEGKRRRQN